jgi:N-acetylmuramoyl-L-alanine amidase
MKNNIFVFLLAVVAWLALLPAAWAAPSLDVKVDGTTETLLLEDIHAEPLKLFSLQNPDRLVVDLPSLPQNPQLRLPPRYAGELLKQVRFAQFSPQVSRIVFDLHHPVSVEGTSLRAGTLSIQLKPKQAAAVAAKPASGNAKKTSKELKPTKPRKPVVVIDAGHGGIDPGAIGPRGTKEKDIVLEYARALQSKLLKTGKYKVVLTREGDTFIMLRKRVEIARKAKGDIFISLHADSALDNHARGLSVYTVSEKASDAEAEALAARENKADIIAGIDLSSEREDVAGILISLAQRETKNNSATLADILVSSLNDRVRLLENTHRFAGFAVLKAPDIPSVLVETGFLSHPEEEKLLKTRAYREKVVAGLAEGIDRYFDIVPTGGEP